tara:strand:- start:242 stop:778 length:537 start_codon:yes stop_codon:yes gene_type:complete
MKHFLILSFSFLFLASCEVSQSKNIYIPPNTKTKPIENFVYYSDENSLKNIKNKIKKILIINQNDSITIKPEEISSFIDCGYMNDEIYVDYINRIFNSSLTIQIIFKVRKLDNKNILYIDFDYIFKSKETGTTWRFSSKKSKNLLVGNPVYDNNPYRECLSKQKIESSLKNVLEYQLK